MRNETIFLGLPSHFDRVLELAELAVLIPSILVINGGTALVRG